MAVAEQRSVWQLRPPMLKLPVLLLLLARQLVVKLLLLYSC
jgi:hypothetical protein